MTRLRLSARPASLGVCSLLVGLVMAPAPANDDGWDRARLKVEDAFAGGTPAKLRSLLPPDSKVFLDLSSPRPVRGYFGVNQVLKVLEEFFTAHPVVGFELTAGSAAPAGGSGAIRGFLRFRTPEGSGGRLTLSVVLMRVKAGWTIREVREGA